MIFEGVENEIKGIEEAIEQSRDTEEYINLLGKQAGMNLSVKLIRSSLDELRIDDIPGSQEQVIRLMYSQNMSLKQKYAKTREKADKLLIRMTETRKNYVEIGTSLEQVLKDNEILLNDCKILKDGIIIVTRTIIDDLERMVKDSGLDKCKDEFQEDIENYIITLKNDIAGQPVIELVENEIEGTGEIRIRKARP